MQLVLCGRHQGNFARSEGSRVSTIGPAMNTSTQCCAWFSSTRKKWRAEAKRLLNEEARLTKPAGTYCAECISYHEATSAKHRWWYTLPEYKSTDLGHIEKRIRKLKPRLVVCGCGMHYADDYGCFDSDYDSEYDYEYDLPFGLFEAGH